MRLAQTARGVSNGGMLTTPRRRASRPIVRPAALLVAASLTLCSLAFDSSAAEGPTPLPFEEVADGVYVHHGLVEQTTEQNQGAIANIGFVVGDHAVAMIDSGGSVEEGKAALAAIRAVTDKPVRYLVNTHMHPDHVFGNQVFKAAGATIVGHRREPEALASRAESYRVSMAGQLGAALMDEITITPPDETVADTRDLDLGGRILHLKAWGTAHTDNDLTVYDGKTRTLFAGDLVFLQHTPVVDGSILGWLKQTPELEAIPAERVVPGHGPVSAPWPQGIAPQTRYLKTLAADLRAAIGKGVPIEKAAREAGASERDEWKLFDDYNPRNATAAYAELEWE